MGRMTASPGRRVLLAAPRGYCAGVDRAVIAVEKALEQYGAPIYVRHEIVHNKYVVQTLQKKGAIFVEQTAEVPEGAIVMFSAHGVAPVVHDEAAAGKLATIDATCPLVTKVHKEAVRFAQDDFDILLIGHEGHEEVIGTSGEAPEHITLVDGPGDVPRSRSATPPRSSGSPRPRCRSTRPWRRSTPSRTSSAAHLPAQRRHLLRHAEPSARGEADGRAGGAGDRGRLAQLLQLRAARGGRQARRRARGLPRDYADEIDETWLEGVSTVGVTSGASVPEVLVEQVLEYLSARGYEDVELVKAAEESITFSLPKELRRDLRAEAAALVAERTGSTPSAE